MELYDTQKLKNEHKRLEISIEDEYSRPAPDATRLGALKRLKLRIKDQIMSATGT